MTANDQKLRESLVEQYDLLGQARHQLEAGVKRELQAIEDRRRADQESYDKLTALREQYHQTLKKMSAIKISLMELNDPLPLSFTPEEE